MKKTLLVILMRSRRRTAVDVQKLLTDHGCIIKTRLGLHDGGPSKCSDAGLIILEMAGMVAEIRALDKKLNKIPGLKTKLVQIAL